MEMCPAKVDIDLSGVEQLVETSQTRAVGDAVKMLANSAMPKTLSVPVRIFIYTRSMYNVYCIYIESACIYIESVCICIYMYNSSIYFFWEGETVRKMEFCLQLTLCILDKLPRESIGLIAGVFSFWCSLAGVHDDGVCVCVCVLAGSGILTRARRVFRRWGYRDEDLFGVAGVGGREEGGGGACEQTWVAPGRRK